MSGENGRWKMEIEKSGKERWMTWDWDGIGIDC